MGTLYPIEFFLWDKPRVLVDIRPLSAFRKGSLKNAISLPLEEFSSIKDFLSHHLICKNKLPLHIIDVNGESANELAKHVPLVFIKGGYKYFKLIRDQEFETEVQVKVLGGYTGSGKTDLLHLMQQQGHQVINLEDLARHRGSVFGKRKNKNQPLHEHFQNKLLKIWLSFDKNKPVWIEEKGPFLGKTGIPLWLQKKMKYATLYHLQVPFEKRLKYSYAMYQDLSSHTIREAIKKLEPRMGTSENHKALYLYNTLQIEKCIRLLMDYYDNGYDQRRQACWKGPRIMIEHDMNAPHETLKQIEGT